MTPTPDEGGDGYDVFIIKLVAAVTGGIGFRVGDISTLVADLAWRKSRARSMVDNAVSPSVTEGANLGADSLPPASDKGHKA